MAKVELVGVAVGEVATGGEGTWCPLAIVVPLPELAIRPISIRIAAGLINVSCSAICICGVRGEGRPSLPGSIVLCISGMMGN